jgi:hypothetical protein
VKGDEIVVTSSTGFRAAYLRRRNRPQLIVWRRTETDDEVASGEREGARAWMHSLTGVHLCSLAMANCLVRQSSPVLALVLVPVTFCP